jgi:phosphoglycolate phosphatase-like HAD superfamily hydrolase
MGSNRTKARARVAICDLDGTLIDSDQANADAFVALGVPRQEVSFGHILADECARLGLSVDAFLDVYDERSALPFPGVAGLIDGLGVWAVCSHKHPVSGRAELHRLEWTPTVAMFADAFSGAKSVVPVLKSLDIDAADAVFLGDTAHDRHCAHEAGVTFALAGWNPRTIAAPGDLVLSEPRELLDLLDLLDLQG